MNMLDLEIVVNEEEKTATDSKTEERKIDAHVTCIVCSCQRKVAGILF